MIFISDLDKTLIFSKKHLPTTEKLYLAEFKQDLPYSFMSKKTLTNIKDFIYNGGIFIPATARTEEQYNRIFLFKDLAIKYAILCNGKSILINGEKDFVWEDKMNSELSKLPEQIQDLFPKIKEFAEKNLFANKNYYIYDNYLAMITVPTKQDLPVYFIKLLNGFLKHTGWNAFSCGRKIYIGNHIVNKKNALEYIIENCLDEKHEIVASGDSLYDMEMLDYADLAITPANAEIANNFKTTLNPDFKGSNEITNILHEKYISFF